jgi:hypothetical protein
VRIASRPYCAHQIFALGKHRGMQYHVDALPSFISFEVQGQESEWRGRSALPLTVSNSAIAAVGDQSHQQPHCAGKLPSPRKSP